MSSHTLFAFKMAQPLENLTEGEAALPYDPQTQTSIWQGGDSPQASVRCVGGGSGEYCNAYGSYCTTWGSYIPDGYGWRCS